MKLILASGSPRRAEILRNACIPFEARPAALDESLHTGELPGDYIRRLALAKARAVAAAIEPPDAEAIVIGADTVVVAGDEILGKPVSADDARRMLRLFAGSRHKVHTGLALVRHPDGAQRVGEEITRVYFAPMSDAEIESYVATGEPFDKAGAYGIQGIGGRYVTRIEGCYFNVMGLPLAKLWSLLEELGWESSHRNAGA